MKKAFYAIAFALGFVLMPVAADAYTAQGKCIIAENSTDYNDYYALHYEEMQDGGWGCLFRAMDNPPGMNVPQRMAWDPDMFYWYMGITDFTSVHLDGGEWTGTDQQWMDFCAAGFVDVQTAPSGNQTLMPLASSTALVSDISGRYGWIVFSAIAGFMGMLFVWNVIVFAYNRIRKLFEPTTRDDIKAL